MLLPVNGKTGRDRPCEQPELVRLEAPGLLPGLSQLSHALLVPPPAFLQLCQLCRHHADTQCH